MLAILSCVAKFALGAILFLYRHVLEQPLGFLDAVRASKPKRLPTVLSRMNPMASAIVMEPQKLLDPAAIGLHLALVGSIPYCSELPGSRWVLASAPKAEAATLVAESLVEQWDFYQTKDLLLAYAACRGYPRLADHLDRYETLVTRPKCAHHFEPPSSIDT